MRLLRRSSIYAERIQIRWKRPEDDEIAVAFGEKSKNENDAQYARNALLIRCPQSFNCFLARSIGNRGLNPSKNS